MFYSVGIIRTLSQRDSISRDPERTAMRRQGEEPGYTEILRQRAGSPNIKRLLFIKENHTSQVKGFSVFLMRDTQVQSLVWEDALKEEMATHSSILTWEIPWTETPGSLQFMGSQTVGHDWARRPSPSPENLPSPEIKPTSPALTGGLFTTEPPGKLSQPKSWESCFIQWELLGL